MNRQYLITLRAHYSSVMSVASYNGLLCKCLSPVWWSLTATEQLRSLGERSPSSATSSWGAAQSLGFMVGAQITLHPQTLPAKGFLTCLFWQRNSITNFIILFEPFIEQQAYRKVQPLTYLSHIFLICHCTMTFKTEYTSPWKKDKCFRKT